MNRHTAPLAWILCTLLHGCLTSAVVAAQDGEAGDSMSDAVARPDGSLPTGDLWDGYIESFMFPSGSDHVRIAFDPASGDGPRTGVVIFGMGTPPPPATDPTVGYPPGFNPRFVRTPTIVEGFAYPVAMGMVTGARVQVTVNLGAVWSGWCALQTPVALDDAGTSYGCLPNAGFMTGPTCSIVDLTTQMLVPIDCTRLYLCMMGRVCDCNATQCQAGMVGQVAFDFQVTGNNGDGSVMLDTLHNLHLTR